MARFESCLAVALVLACLLPLRASAAPDRPVQLLPGLLVHIRFSPDGRYVLAQSHSQVTVLTVQPFAVLFSIPIESATVAEFSADSRAGLLTRPSEIATLAQFSPDSRDVLFAGSVRHLGFGKPAPAELAAHVERWSVAGRKCIQSTRISAQSCETLKLSPDGNILVCVDFQGTLHFLDVASGKPVYKRKGVLRPFVSWYWAVNHMYTRSESGDLGSAGIEFSPDGRYALVAGTGNSERRPVAGWDSVARRELPPRGTFKRAWVAGDFVFVAPDRVLIKGYKGRTRRARGVYTGDLVEVPSARVVARPRLPAALRTREGEFCALASDPRFVILRLCPACPAGALDYRTGLLLSAIRSPVLDVLGGRYVAQQADGEIGLYEIGKSAPIATVRLETR
jgi:hypothetical protein